MSAAISEDGTTIAYDRRGAGSAVILVGGGATDRSENAPLAEVLAEHFTVINYDRRGRGASGDTPPYAVAREVEDLAALIDAVGGRASLYGVSSGGALALEAAAAGLPVDRVGVYEVPYNVAEDWPRRWRDYTDELHRLLAEDRRGDAFALFMRLAETPEADIAAARTAPFWPQLEALAPTLAYDAACLGDGRPPRERLARITRPVLVATGEPRPGPEWVRALPPAADAIAAAIPDATRTTLEGSGHVADPATVTAALVGFLG